MANITLFAQVIGKMPKENIRKIIRTAQTDKHCKGYDTWSQLISMVFCQFSECDSVRDISNGLKSATGNLNHLGISRAPSKSTIAYQNAHRDSNVFRDIFYMLFRHFGQQSAWQRKNFRFKMPIKLLDSTLVSLTMSVYDWAHYTTKKGAVKMHTLLDYDCLLPEFVNITTGKVTDNKASYDIPVAPHSIVIADRGHCDYSLLNHWDSNKTIALLYKARWQIEVFFRNLKQLLGIKSFIGTTRNAVEIQIWTALITMLLLCWLKHEAKYKWTLSNLVVSLRLNTFIKIELQKWLDEPFTPPPDTEIMDSGD